MLFNIVQVGHDDHFTVAACSENGLLLPILGDSASAPFHLLRSDSFDLRDMKPGEAAIFIYSWVEDPRVYNTAHSRSNLLLVLGGPNPEIIL